MLEQLLPSIIMFCKFESIWISILDSAFLITYQLTDIGEREQLWKIWTSVWTTFCWTQKGRIALSGCYGNFWTWNTGFESYKCGVQLTTKILLSFQWKTEILDYCPSTRVLLIGCKIDLRTDLSTLMELSHQKQAPISYEQVSLSVMPLLGMRFCSPRLNFFHF